MQNVLPSLALSPEEETEEEVTIQEKEKMINISYELAAEASKRSKVVAGMSLKERGAGGGVLIHMVHVGLIPLCHVFIHFIAFDYYFLGWLAI